MVKKIFVIFLALSIIPTIAACNHNDKVYYVVTFCSESVEIASEKVQSGFALTEPSDLTRDGYTFLYWADEEGNEFSFDSPITSDLVLTAVWKQNVMPPTETKVRVRFFDADGVQIGNDQILNKGDDAKAPAIEPEEFFVYDWDNSYVNVQSDLDIHAVKKYDAANSELFTYQKVGASYTITGLANGAELPHMSNGFVRLALPESYNDLPITAIGEGAFENKNIYSLFIPSCYTTIGDNAFKANATLSSVLFNEGLTSIGANAFMASDVSGHSFSGNIANPGMPVYESGLSQLDFPSTLTEIGDYAFFQIGKQFENNVIHELSVKVNFDKCKNLSYIGNHAFEGVMIQSLLLPQTDVAIHIGDYAFAADTYTNWVKTGSSDYPRSQLTYISLPSSVNYIGDYAFFGCGSLDSYHNGTYYLNSMSVLLDSEKLTLEYLGEGAFMGCMLIGSLDLSVSVINDFAFLDNHLLSIKLSNVTQIGQFAFAGMGNEDTVSVELGDELISIGDYAFYNNFGIKTIKFPNTLETIGNSAFENCLSISGKLVLPASLQTVGAWAFSLTDISSVEILGNVILMRQCFNQCIQLQEVQGNIAYADIAVFYGCSNLKNITLSNSIHSISYGMFYGCESLESITLPVELSGIDTLAFYGCTSLKSINIPNKVSRIGPRAFEYCLSLIEVNFEGDELNTIDTFAFALCYNLTSIDLPDSVNFIGDFAFAGTGLTSFTTPAALNYMGYGVFYQQDYIKTEIGEDGIEYSHNIKLPVIDSFVISENTGFILFDQRGTFYGADILGFEVEAGNATYAAMDGILYSSDCKKLIMYIRNDSLTSVELIDGLEEIEDGAFMNCPALKRVKLPDTLVTIGDYAFCNCSTLDQIILPDSVKKIGAYAFAGNISLTSVAIPSSVVNIGVCAFYNCSSLINLDLSNAVNLTLIGDFAFSGINSYSAPKIESLDFTNCESLLGTGSYAFSECPNLKRIEFGPVTKVDKGSFYNCAGLNNLKIGEYITEIGEYAFNDCTALTNIIVPNENALMIIGDYAFAGKMSNYMNFEVLDLTNATHLTQIKEGAFSYGNVKEVYLPDTPFKLQDEVFDRCSNLTNIDFGGVTEIGENVIRLCKQIKKLNIPYSVTTIGKDAFRELDIEEVNIGSPQKGNSIDQIGKNAFFNCLKLKKVNIYGKNVPMLSGEEYNYSFHCTDSNGNQSVISGLSIVVDADMRDVYLNSGLIGNGWAVYESILTERTVVGGSATFERSHLIFNREK